MSWGSDGSLNVELSGGYGAYNVTLFNGNDIQIGQTVSLDAGVSIFDFNNLSESEYYVIVLDELGCSVLSNFVTIEDLLRFYWKSIDSIHHVML